MDPNDITQHVSNYSGCHFSVLEDKFFPRFKFSCVLLVSRHPEWLADSAEVTCGRGKPYKNLYSSCFLLFKNYFQYFRCLRHVFLHFKVKFDADIVLTSLLKLSTLQITKGAAAHTCTGWSRGYACFSYKNNFVYFEHKKVLITQKRTYFNIFLKYIPNYIRKVISVRWRPSCQTHIRSHSSKSCITRSNISCGRAAIYWRMESFRSSIVGGLFV
jgi:hypothetical protein